MWDFLLDLVRVNEEINYSLIISVVVGYLFFVWFIICVWVYFDARKRFVSNFTSIAFAFFSLIFGPPALIFYIMVRPEHTLEEDYLMNMALSGEKQAKPIYFEGNKGFDITFNLSVKPKAKKDGKHKMDMMVEWYPTDEEFESKKPDKKNNAEKFFVKIGNFIRHTKESIDKKIKEITEKETGKKGKKKLKKEGKNIDKNKKKEERNKKLEKEKEEKKKEKKKKGSNKKKKKGNSKKK